MYKEYNVNLWSVCMAKEIKENVPAEEAKEIEAKLKEAGATVELA